MNETVQRLDDVLASPAGDEDIAGRVPGELEYEHDMGGLTRPAERADDLVCRLFERARRVAREEGSAQAIPWLQEALLTDPTRRDVARWIGEMRRDVSRGVVRRKRRGHLALAVFVLSTMGSALVTRESALREDVANLPTVVDSDPASAGRRLAAMDQMLSARAPWFGMFDLEDERDSLRSLLATQERKDLQRERAGEEARNRKAQAAQAASTRGWTWAGRGEFTKARVHFEEALRVAPAGWELRERIIGELAAIDAWETDVPTTTESPEPADATSPKSNTEQDTSNPAGEQ